MSNYVTIACVRMEAGESKLLKRESDTLRQAIDDFLCFVGEHEGAPVMTYTNKGEEVLRTNHLMRKGTISLDEVRQEMVVN